MLCGRSYGLYPGRQGHALLPVRRMGLSFWVYVWDCRLHPDHPYRNNRLYSIPGKSQDDLRRLPVPGTVKQSTYISYEGYVRLHLVPELGNVRLSALSTEQIQRFFNKKKRDNNGKTGGLTPTEF